MGNKKNKIKLPKHDSLYVQELKFMSYVLKQSIRFRKKQKQKQKQL